MWFRKKKKKKLSVVVVFHNMRREAERTLYSLSADYQKDLPDLDYEVIAVDSNSEFPLDEARVKNFGEQFCYKKVFWNYPSPCKALNSGVMQSQGEYVMCLIDGARILSPGILSKTLESIKQFKNPFIYTLGMHLGPKVQNESVLEGYNQLVEDELLATIPWKENGYDLFSVSSVALSSKEGFYSMITESNCFAINKTSYFRLGGMNEKFVSPGGGIVNLDFFQRATEATDITPVMLLGEATFHQYHGGVATNVPLEKHPWKKFAKEYFDIYDQKYKPFFRSPIYFGEIPEEAVFLANTRENSR